MKIGLFSDTHYCHEKVLCGTRYPSLSLKKVRETMSIFRKEKVDVCICLGDLVDKFKQKSEAVKCVNQIMTVIRESGIPCYVIQGNHDCNNFSACEFSEMTNSPLLPCVLDIGNYSFIFIDANFRQNGKSFFEAGVEWTDSNVPSYQVDFLKNALDISEKSCIVILHENLDPTVQEEHIVKNAKEIRDVIEKSGKVHLVLQGHYHKGADTLVNGIRYLTVPAMCEGTENHYIILEV